MDFKKKYLEKQRDLKEEGIYPPFPRIVKIDVCNTCNYCCVFCPQSKQTDKKGNIDKELCLKIIKDSYDVGATELCLSMTGEPLLNPNLEEFIVYGKKLGYRYIFFNTNGFLCDEERGKSLLLAGVDSIKFSINADERLYCLIHGVDGFQTVIKNLKALYNYRNQIGSSCKIYVSYIAVKQTIEEAEILKERIRDYCDDFIIMNANNRAGSISELDKGLFAGNDEYAFQYPCSQLFNNVYVTAEGYMIICCQDFENMTVVADLNKESIASAWNNERFTNFRRQYLSKNIKDTLCYNCIYNCNYAVMPLSPEYAGYEESPEKIKNLNERIKKLVMDNMEERIRTDSSIWTEGG